MSSSLHSHSVQKTHPTQISENIASMNRQVDPLVLGHRIRNIRKQRGITLQRLAGMVNKAQSFLSMIENGKREPKLSHLQDIANALECELNDFFEGQEFDRRTQLEIQLQRAQSSQIFQSLSLPEIKIGPSLSDEALEIMYGLYAEIGRLKNERLATPEEARRANAQLRRLMRDKNNHFAELEKKAAELLTAVGHQGGPITQRATSNIAEYLGFDLHYVTDLPRSTQSVTDLRNRRIYLSDESRGRHDPRSSLLNAFASHLLEHREPENYADFLNQRVEANYLAAAILIPEKDAVKKLQQAKQERQISIEDLRDTFAVSYEMAAHRFTNLATKHLGIPVHFMRVDDDGTITKVYENDGVPLPSDSLGGIEGQQVCRHWSAKKAFEVPDKFHSYSQYTDTPNGTFWCTSRILVADSSAAGNYSITLGVPFSSVGFFSGRETKNRQESLCPDPSCCKNAPQELSDKWSGQSWPNATAPRNLLATLPTGSFPGVDQSEVFQFLEEHEKLF